MAAIDIIEANYTNLKGQKRAKEAEGRKRIAREMTALQNEFDALVFRAKAEGSSITAIATEMSVSRTLIYQILARAEVLDKVAPLIVDPLAEFVVWDETSWTFRVTSPAGETIELDAVRGYQVATIRDGDYVVPSQGWRDWFEPMSADVEAWIAAQNKGPKL